MVKLTPKQSKYAIFVVILILTNVITAIIASSSNNTVTQTSTTNSAQPVVSLNATELQTQLPQYANQIVEAQGDIVSSKGIYYILGQGNPAGLIRLDFSKTKLSPSRYLTKSNSSLAINFNTKTAVTVSGSVSWSDSNKSYSIQVGSVK